MWSRVCVMIGGHTIRLWYWKYLWFVYAPEESGDMVCPSINVLGEELPQNLLLFVERMVELNY